ncbi:hypothetical protein CC78DRAFT_468640, partial [Lojkania enalia]
TIFSTPGWLYAFNEPRYTTSKIELEWFKHLIDRLLSLVSLVQSFNYFGKYKTLKILEYYLENNIILCRLPSYTSY